MSETETISGTSYRVKLIGVLGAAAGTRAIEIESRRLLVLSDLISTLLAHVNKTQFTELLIDSATNNPLPNVIILLNEQDCNLFQGLKTKLAPGTLVTIIPVAHGG